MTRTKNHLINFINLRDMIHGSNIILILIRADACPFSNGPSVHTIFEQIICSVLQFKKYVLFGAKSYSFSPIIISSFLSRCVLLNTSTRLLRLWCIASDSSFSLFSAGVDSIMKLKLLVHITGWPAKVASGVKTLIKLISSDDVFIACGMAILTCTFSKGLAPTLSTCTDKIDIISMPWLPLV